MSLPTLFIGTTREHYILLFGAVSAIGLVAGVIGAWIGGYLGARRAVRTAQLSVPDNTAAALQLGPILQALDAISVEVERISEAQRFTARVLSERQAVVLPRSEVKSVTPH